MSDELSKLDTDNDVVLQSAHTMLLYCVILAGYLLSCFFFLFFSE